MSSGGRKQDSCWQYFEKIVIPGKHGSRAKCKSCSKDMIGLVVRMKEHLDKCIGGQQHSALLTSESSDPAMPQRVLLEE